MRWFLCKRSLTLTATLVLSLALTQAAHADSQTIYNRLLKSTGWINCPQPNNTSSWGSCWVVDRQERLVITNRHVIDAATEVMVDFPMYREGKLVTKLTEYLNFLPFKGKVLVLDAKRDLALCQMERMPDDVVALPLAKSSAVRGNKIFSIGNSGANTPVKENAVLWRMASGHVDMRYFDCITFQKGLNQKVEAHSIRATLPSAGGDSGGPVVNTDGELVGVHSNGDRFHSFSIDVVDVKIFLERAMQSRRLPAQPRDVVGTWTVATTDDLGRCYWSLTVHGNGTCMMERDDCFEGTFQSDARGETVRLAIPGMALKGDNVRLSWTNDDQFSFACNGKDFTAVRR